MRQVLNIIIICTLSGGFCWSPCYASSKKQKELNKAVEKTINSYRTGEYSAKKTWVHLSDLSRRKNYLTKSSLARIKTVQAQILKNEGYPILSALHASESIKLSQSPYDRENIVSWKILHNANLSQPIDYIVDDLALKYMSINELPKFFGNDWNYFIANSLMDANKTTLARTYYRKLKMSDRYYLPAQYQISMINIEKGEYDDAESRLKAILNDVPQNVSSLDEKAKEDMIAYAHMALGRMYYEQRRFILSSFHYRRVPKNNLLYYDSLFEQSWALFMAGKSKHALGSLYGAHSPYFKNSYNPESKILESMIYFWMCRYDEARNALADFVSLHAEAVGGLKTFLKRQRLTPETTYQLFENLVTGVSSQSLGISRQVLKTASERDSMLMVRSQYASIIEERSRIDSEGVLNTKKGVDQLIKRLDRLTLDVRRELGSTFLKELRYLDDHFSDLYTQAQFLYLELLMGQKEHLLGRELHAENKVRKVGDITKMKSWSEKTQSWKDEKSEYWWDEVGYQIIDVDPVCN